MDETYIRVKGKWVYLYRAVDSSGATIDFLLSAKRDAAAAERFLAKAFGGDNHPARGGSCLAICWALLEPSVVLPGADCFELYLNRF